MDLLGVGPLEFIFVLLIIFLVLGPNDIAATGKKIGRFLAAVRKSEFWRGVNQITREVRTLPTTLMREAELEDAKKELEKTAKELGKDVEDIKNLPREFDPPELKSIGKEIQEELGKEPKILPDPPPQADAGDAPQPEEVPETGDAPQPGDAADEEGED